MRAVLEECDFDNTISKLDEALNENPGEHFTPRDADHIAYGSTLSHDRHAGQTFDDLIATPRTARTGSATRTPCGPSTSAAPSGPAPGKRC
ncbi:MAG: hypothetical protein CO164_07725 [Rhodocyclales bacterium CG_4_9_14_3_um_filter_68_10]|nr:MAG: hypothetical protein CO164_07725 [Rhodocyclales bacterium CG_4_9_14_3_um_filter_68_10]